MPQVLLGTRPDVPLVDGVEEPAPAQPDAEEQQCDDEQWDAERHEEVGERVGTEPQHDAHEAHTHDDLAQGHHCGVPLVRFLDREYVRRHSVLHAKFRFPPYASSARARSSSTSGVAISLRTISSPLMMTRG